MIYIRQPYPNELYHHGIKGQKWGIRRFQNADGSLTSAEEFEKLQKDLAQLRVEFKDFIK